MRKHFIVVAECFMPVCWPSNVPRLRLTGVLCAAAAVLSACRPSESALARKNRTDATTKALRTASAAGPRIRPTGGPGGETPSVVRGSRETVTMLRGELVMTDSGGTFRPCGRTKVYMVGGSQEATYLMNEQFRFTRRRIRAPAYLEVRGYLIDDIERQQKAPTDSMRSALEPSAATNGRPSRPQLFMTKFMKMTAIVPRDCAS